MQNIISTQRLLVFVGALFLGASSVSFCSQEKRKESEVSDETILLVKKGIHCFLRDPRYQKYFIRPNGDGKSVMVINGIEVSAERYNAVKPEETKKE